MSSFTPSQNPPQTTQLESSLSVLSPDIRFRIRAHAVVEPERLLTSDQLDNRLRLPPGTCYRLSGVKTRRWTARSESLTQMGAQAVRQAIDEANMSFGDLDLLISCGASCEQHIPCGAVLIQEALEESGTGVSCFDIDATCLGFLRALELSARLVGSGAYARIMIVAAERPSIALNPMDPKTRALFGDGAAAYLIEAAPSAEPCFVLKDASFASYGEYAEACQLVGGGSRLPGLMYRPETHDDFLFQMNGPQLFKACLKTFPPFVREFLARNGKEMQELRWVVPHQASRAALLQMKKHLKIPGDRMVDILETHGNQVAASIPTALSHALCQGPLEEEDHILLLGTGAGLGLGIALLQWKAS